MVVDPCRIDAAVIIYGRPPICGHIYFHPVVSSYFFFYFLA